jgi:hypothetical protein
MTWLKQILMKPMQLVKNIAWILSDYRGGKQKR